MRRSILFSLLLPWGMLYAGRIDVTHQPSVTLEPGNSLLFHIGIWNYAAYTGTYPDRINIALASLPPDGPSGAFRASLESLHGTALIPLFGLGFQANLYLAGGYFTSANYTGPVSILQAGAALTSAQSAALFGDEALIPGNEGAVIRIDNLGGPVTLSWPDESVRNAFHVSLEGRWFSIGAAGGPVELLASPEPASFWLLLGVVSFAGVARMLRKKR